MHDRTDIEASQKAPVVLGVAAHPFDTSKFFESDSESESNSHLRGDSPPTHSQEDGTGSRPKVSRAS